MSFLSSSFRFNTLVFLFYDMIYNNGGGFLTFCNDLLHVKFKSVRYFVLLDMNLNEFNSDLGTIVSILSIDPKFASIVEELLKKALCVLDDSMSRYYPVF